MAIEKYIGEFSKEDNGCTIVVNETINYITDIPALALYIYLSCRPPQWKLNVNQISEHFNCGENKAYKMISTLIKMGLLVKEERRDKGKFLSVKYTLKLKPILPSDENHQTDKTLINKGLEPFDDLSHAVFPRAVNHHTYKTKNIKNKDNNKTPISPLTKIPEEQEVIDPNFKHKETYYPMANISVACQSSAMCEAQLYHDNPYKIPEQMISDWFMFRRKKRLLVTQSVWNGLMKEVGKCKDRVGAFEMIVVSGWQSFRAEWAEPNLKSNKNLDHDNGNWANGFNEESF